MKNWFELIEQYIDNELNADGRKQVEILLAQNSEFSQEFKLHMGVNNAILERDVINLRQSLEDIYRNSKEDTGTTIRKLYQKKWHYAAASATILILLGSILLTNQKTPQAENLFNNYYHAETSIMITRSSNIDIDNDVRTALQFYSNAEYQKAINLFQNNQENVISKFYLGLSFIETSEYEKAKNSFQAVLDHNDNLFIEQSTWYKALCLLKLEENSEAIQLFTTIENSNSLFKDQASEIIKSMK